MAPLLQVTAPIIKSNICFLGVINSFPSGLNQLNPIITRGILYKSVLTADYLYKQTTPSVQGQRY